MPMTKRFRLTFGLLPTLLMAADVKTFPAKDVDLSVYRTYTLLPTRVLTGNGVVENDPEVSPLIAEALRKQLSRKGLTEQSEGADLEVAAGGLAVSIPQVEALVFNPSNDATWGTSPIAVLGRYNKEGTLIVNLIDPRMKKSVWLGVTKRALGKPSTLKKDIDKATEAMFKKYPPLK